MGHQPYSPDLVPNDLFLLPHFENKLYCEKCLEPFTDSHTSESIYTKQKQTLEEEAVKQTRLPLSTLTFLKTN
ncbi:hypothetical protein J6590_009315 [Homalodisca vitripennis]|nr:hypothetical protein J6590_009315 [Homalodisca vitripennis]